MYFLLDTNLFIDYVKDAKDEYFIEQIIVLAEEGAIQILVPDVLLSEWKEKKETTLEFIFRQFKATVTISVNEWTDNSLKEEYKHSQARAGSVDKLLSNGIQIKTPQKVKAEIIDRSLAHVAPFHGGKTKTTNDALIYFSAVYYLKKNKISKFVFITKDSGDFGSPDKKNETLHSDLEDRQLTTLYYTSLFKCFDELKDELKIKQPDKEGPYQLIISKRKNKNLLDHIFDVICTYRSKINFLPTHILSKIEPFRIIDIKHDYAYHSGTTLLTNNKALLEFFKQVDIKKMRFKNGAEFRNTKKNLDKLNYIITCLNENLVFSISHVTYGEQIDLHKDVNKECNCALCLYKRLSFGTLLKEIYNEKDTLKKAFVLFQLGRFNESLIAYNSIYEDAIKEDSKVLAYRILLVLQWVSHFAEYESNEAQGKALIKKVNSIDRDKAFFSALSGGKLDKELALFFHGSTMIDYFSLLIKDGKEKIREHYNSQLKGSYSSNSNLKNLIESFLNFEMFTVYNGMAITKYSDFESISNDFIEAIFMSIALNEYQSSRIDYLDDYILERLLFYGKADKMIGYFNRYVKKQIPYQSVEKSFQKIASNFLNSDVTTIECFSNANYYEGSTSFYKVFWNLLSLLSIVEFDKEFVVDCTKKIYNFLERLPKRETRQIHHLGSLISSKGKYLKKHNLQSLFKLVTTNPNLHNEEVFQSISFIKNFNFKFDLIDSEFEYLCGLFFNQCEKCGVTHTNILFDIYPLLRKRYQLKIKIKINKQLEDNFNKELYYLSVLGDIIDYKPHFSQYTNLINDLNKPVRRPLKYLEGEIHYPELNELMNLVFKTKAALPTALKDKFKGLTDYYDWLIDMQGFDYKKFKPIWLLQYGTKYYLEQAFSFKKVKDAVRHFLHGNNQPTLAYYYSSYVI